jgi:hypothetical protein
MWDGISRADAPLLEQPVVKTRTRRVLPFVVSFFLLVTGCAVVFVLLRREDESFTPGSPSRHQSRLRIANGCAADSLWIANFAFQSAYFPQDVEIKAGQVHARSACIVEAACLATDLWYVRCEHRVWLAHAGARLHDPARGPRVHALLGQMGLRRVWFRLQDWRERRAWRVVPRHGMRSASRLQI